MNFLSNFKMDEWYKLVAGISAVVLVFGLFVDSVVIGNKSLVLISLGAFLFSITEWGQYKERSSINPFRILSWTEREVGLFPFLMKLLSISLISWGIIILL